MKHITPKDVVEFLLIAVGFMSLMVIASILESAPLGIALFLGAGLSIILWFVWATLVVIQRNREARKPKLKVMRNGKWVDVDSSEGMSVIYSSRANAQLFDQDADAINHLDFNKEQA